MPSIPQLISLRQKYGDRNRIETKALRVINENFSQSAERIKSSLSFQGLSTDILAFFERQESAGIVLLYIDITGFSTKCKQHTNSQLAAYLDNYYDLVIPVIYTHGGEIEKIMGDGIIAVFGQPFLSDDKNELFSKADKCAKDLIMLLKGTDKEVKVALHDGSIMYYKNKSLNYPEYTIIGKPLTELYRLESVALNNSISYYYASLYDNQPYCKDGTFCITTNKPIRCGAFSKSQIQSTSLQGIDYSFIRHLTCTYAT